MNISSPAKLNLFLRILGKRNDGYHQLQTVFQFIDLCDELTFDVTPDKNIQLLCNNLTIDRQTNLVYRAALALQSHTRCQQGAAIHLTKRIPMGAGLGGGSSNAASTLVALNHLWRTGLSNQTLQAIGLTLGADVPVFVFGHAAWAQGIGEEFQSIDLHENYYLLLIPNCHVSTQKIFCDPQLTRDALPSTISELSGQLGQNDCESTTRRLYPEVDETMRWLDRHTKAMMTGTGCGVFGRFDTKAAATAIADMVPDTITCFVVKGLNRSPLYQGELTAF